MIIDTLALVETLTHGAARGSGCPVKIATTDAKIEEGCQTIVSGLAAVTGMKLPRAPTQASGV